MKNKSLGVVFTPENIARFMSKILLYNFLTTKLNKEKEIKKLICEKTISDNILKNKIKNRLISLKILEPSVGEGRLLLELSKLLSEIFEIVDPTRKNFYENIISDSLFAYDINNKLLKKAVKNSNGRNKNFINKDFIKANLDNEIKYKFDIIIGNPPYINEKENKKLFENYKYTKYYQGRMNIWYLFMQYSIDLLKPDGILTYLIPNNWTTNKGALKLRNSLKNKTRILSVVDFGEDMIFKDAQIQTMILTLKRENKKRNEKVFYCQHKKKTKNENLKDFLVMENFNNKIIDFQDRVNFIDIDILNLLNKIKKAGNFKLIKIKEITQGIVHPQKSVSKRDLALNGNLKLNEGVFVITNEEKERLNINKEEKNIIKPTYTAKNLNKYFKISDNEYWTIYTDRTFNLNNKIDKYPNIKRHLNKYKTILTSDYKPYGLHRKRKEYFFKEGDKIIVPRKSVIPVFTFMEEENYPTFTFNVIKSERINLKYLTMLLNSKLVLFWLKYRGKLQGSHFQLDIAPLIDIPIKYINVNSIYIKELENKLNFLLKEKRLDEKTIFEADKLIYEIYGLNDTEIDIIEKDIERTHGKYLIR